MHNEDEMKRKGAQPATKDDLDRFATKDDLKRFATKDDLDRFATKDDLKRFATKDDLKRFATKDDLAQGLGRCASKDSVDELAAVVRRQSVRLVKVEASVDSLREDVISALRGVESRLTGRMDAFMAATLRVDRDNILLVRRMDKVEERVSRIEQRAT